MKARSIGPAGMSGRITAIAVNPEHTDTWYIGTASGGLWKTVNSGITFDPVFDEQPYLSIGAVAVAPSHPDIIYVGTGEGNPRNTVSSGGGIFKSTNGGASWEYFGLAASKNIHRLIVHPNNPEIVWAGAIGPPFGLTTERGLFKTTDGGENWHKVLYSNDRSGIADLVMKPGNPDVLFAALWEHQRYPWSFESGGSGSGLYRSVDGGKNWLSLGPENGLPQKPWGRIGIAIAPAKPEIMYALVESEKNALYKSIDGGSTWLKINEKTIGSRPFYFSELHVDPKDENRIYNLYSRLALSENGGKDFRVIEDWGRKVHADHHAMWIDPNNPNFIILGTDGGLYWSRDKTRTWNFADDLPVAQFYHVAVDQEMPYNVYGGLQDNGTWYGPAYTWHRAGLRNQYWKELAFNDGFDVAMEKADPDLLYALWQGGMLVRVNKKTGQRKTIRPVDQSVYLRFNWNAALAVDPFQANTLFLGSQFVHKSTDQGNSWSIISPDLTSNDPLKQQQFESGGLTIDATDAENYTTITCIAPSTLKAGLLWVGTDDGFVQLSQDGGKNWKDVSPQLNGLPPGSWVTQIQASAYDPDEAFIVLDNHRRDDWKPYVCHTVDGGQNWILMTKDLETPGYALSFLQDTEVPDLLFLGTEFGLYYSLDRGIHWTLWTNGMPRASITDMVIHPREQDLVLATFGRSFYVLDDIRPLRELAINGKDIRQKPLHLFEIPDATLGKIRQADGQRLSPDRIYTGTNRPYGALISFMVHQEQTPDSVEFTIKKDMEVLFRQKINVSAGLNRTCWNLQRESKASYGPLMDPNLERSWVAPGTYKVYLKSGEHEVNRSFLVHPDPNIPYNPDHYNATIKLRNRLEKLALEKDSLLNALQDSLDQLNTGNILDKRSEETRLQLQAYLNIITPEVKQGVISSGRHIGPRIDKAFYYFHVPYEKPSPNDYLLIEQLEKDWKAAKKQIHVFD